MDILNRIAFVLCAFFIFALVSCSGVPDQQKMEDQIMDVVDAFHLALVAVILPQP